MSRFGLLLLLVGVSLKVWALPSINEFTEKMQHKEGFVDVYYDKTSDTVYLVVEKWQQPFIFQTSLPQGVGSNDIGLDRGQLGETRLAQFERFGNKVFLKQLNTYYRASSTNGAEQASIDEAFADSVIAGFSIVAATDQSVLIDYTAFLLSDVHGISERLKSTQQGNYKADSQRSGVFLPRTKAFVDNTELEALVTFGGSQPGNYVAQVTPEAVSISVHLHHSFVKLPPDGFERRAFHPYSGLWKHAYQDYSAPITESMEQSAIRRHRLAKKDPIAPVSEAVEPIIYYLDPGIPEPVMSALKEGASWWNDAFTAIGYENAFQVKVLPEGADPMDVRYNVIQWVHRATRGWSYGSSVVDPRTGEILKGHVTLGSLRVRQDYLIALGLTSPFNQDSPDLSAQKEMALARIRQLSAHEVGHTLGIAHNFAASENGRESVMDYPHPKITIKDGQLSLEDAYDEGMGAWDKHVIAYGYQDFTSPSAQKSGLARIINEARSKGLKYKSDADARAAYHGSSDGHLWDNGADPIAEFSHISQVRRIALNKMGLDTLADDQSLSSLQNAFVPIYLLHRYQLDALAKQVGGVEYEYEQKGDYTTPKGQTVVNADKQIDALTALVESTSAHYLAVPETVTALLTPKIFASYATREDFSGRFGRVFDPVSAAEAAAGYSVSLLMHPERLNRLSFQHALNSKTPGVGGLLRTLFTLHFYRQSDAEDPLAARLRLVVLDGVMDTLAADDLAPEVRLTMESELLKLEDWLDDHKKQAGNRVLSHYLELYFDSGKWQLDFAVKPLPPGSPI